MNTAPNRVLREETRELTLDQALDLGVSFAHSGNHKSACTMFRGVLKHEPDNFEAIERLGTSLFAEENYYEALYWFWRGRKIDRRHPMALTNYGMCLSQLGHTEEGLPYMNRALYQANQRPLAPGIMSLIYNNLGNTLERLKAYDTALRTLDKGIEFNPDDAFPHYNRGIVLLRLNRHAEAIASFNRSLELDPGNPDAIYNRSMGHLLTGDLKQGFADYEARLLTTENHGVLNLGLPAEKKLGETHPAGQTILVHCEQGLGDTIQMLRFIPQLQAGGAKIVMIIHKALRSLVEGWVEVLEPGSDLTGKYDAWVAVMSLPHMLKVGKAADIPPPWRPHIEPERVAAWKDHVPPAEVLGWPQPKRIGICWAGQFQHKNDCHRSIPLEQFATLFKAENCDFISLQLMRPEDTHTFAKLKERHHNLSALWQDDLRDTAAVMLNLDLVISVDTALLHLAGTLGVPTWGLIPKFGTDWRWQLDRTDSPWYPSMRLVRQHEIGDWATTLKSLRAELCAS